MVVVLYDTMVNKQSRQKGKGKNKMHGMLALSMRGSEHSTKYSGGSSLK